MCKCVDVAMGSYDNQIVLGYYPVMRKYQDNRIADGSPGYGICVDRCIVGEVIALWKAGIRTYGCCCGHNKVKGFINVGEEDFERAISLGYEKYEFPDDPDREDTILIPDE